MNSTQFFSWISFGLMNFIVACCLTHFPFPFILEIMFCSSRHNVATKLLLQNIHHNLRYISFLVFSNNPAHLPYTPNPQPPTHLSFLIALYHRRKLRKQINNSRKINTLYIHITFYKLLGRNDVAKNISRFAHFSFFSSPSLLLLPTTFESFYSTVSSSFCQLENVKLKGVKSVLINLNISL